MKFTHFPLPKVPVIIILSIFLVTVLGMLFYKYKIEKVGLKNTSPAINSTINSPQTNSTLPNLLLYRNEEYNFSFQYPNSFEIVKRQWELSEADYPIYVSVSYMYDLPKFESQYSGMAGNIASQEGFIALEQELEIPAQNHIILKNQSKAEVYVGGSENFQLMKRYRIVSNDHLITIIADATPLLKQKGLERENFVEEDNFTLIDRTPNEVKDFFSQLDLLVETINSSNLRKLSGHDSFNSNALSADEKVFDTCGQIVTYEDSDWYQDFLNVLKKNEIEESSIEEVCFSETEHIAIAAAPGGYCKQGKVLKYSTQDNRLGHATFLNGFYGCPTSPSSFGKRIGNYIEMEGSSGDAGCGVEVEFQYNFVDNLVRKYRSTGSCVNEHDELKQVSYQEFY